MHLLDLRPSETNSVLSQLLALFQFHFLSGTLGEPDHCLTAMAIHKCTNTAYTVQGGVQVGRKVRLCKVAPDPSLCLHVYWKTIQQYGYSESNSICIDVGQIERELPPWESHSTTTYIVHAYYNGLTLTAAEFSNISTKW